MPRWLAVCVLLLTGSSTAMVYAQSNDCSTTNGIDVGNEITQAVSAVVGAVPGVGSLLSGVVNVLYPLIEDANQPTHRDLSEVRILARKSRKHPSCEVVAHSHCTLRMYIVWLQCAWNQIVAEINSAIAAAIDQAKLQELSDTLQSEQDSLREFAQVRPTPLPLAACESHKSRSCCTPRVHCSCIDCPALAPTHISCVRQYRAVLLR
jgi:hypothetical protein